MDWSTANYLFGYGWCGCFVRFSNFYTFCTLLYVLYSKPIRDLRNLKKKLKKRLTGVFHVKKA